MKQLILFFTFIFFVFTNLYCQWDVLNEGFEHWINDISFVNRDIGWVTGSGKLMKTVDGGETWHLLPFAITGSPAIPPEEYHDIKVMFLNDSVGWGIDSYWDQQGDIGKSIIKKSQDGGTTWQTQTTFNDVYLNRIYAVDDSTVFIMGEEKIFKTLNGGAEWIDISLDVKDKTFESIWFINGDIGFVSGADYNTNNGLILKSSDGGTTWDEIKISLFEGIYDLQFINDSTGYFLSRKEDNNFLCTTTDTFKTWSIAKQSPFSIHSYFAQENRTLFVIMDDSSSTNILSSTDNGLSWEHIKLLSNWSFNKIFFVESTAGFILSNFGLLKSTDGGEAWKSQKLNYPLFDTYFQDRNRGFALGGFGYGFHGMAQWGDLFYTDDGGKSWDITISGPGRLLKCRFVNETTGYILRGRRSVRGSSNLTLYKTIDSGLNWRVVTDSMSNFRGNDFFFEDEQNGWVVGYSWSDELKGAGILGTTDRGENWELLWKYPNTEEYDYDLNSIYHSGKAIWAVGESGLIVTSVTPDSFTVIEPFTDLPLNNVFFSDEDHGWIAGGYFNYDEDSFYLKLFKTKDGGQSWQDIPDFNYEINDMFFEDSLHGWAVGNDTSGVYKWPPENGVLLETDDGGENWTALVEGLTAPLTALHFKDGYGWAVGGNGLVLRTEDGVNWIDQNSGKTYPNKFSLSQNYPNPFNPKTTIKYQLPKSSQIELSIYNLLGQKVTTLVNKKQHVGSYKVEWDASGFVSGIYIYQLKAKSQKQNAVFTKKLILLK